MSKIFAICSIGIFSAVLLRILLGPFSYSGVVAFHYWIRVTGTSFLAMITFKTLLRTCFILHFDKMTAISEENVIIMMGIFTSIFTITFLVWEVLLRQHLGLDHFARWCLNTYLGKVREGGGVLLRETFHQGELHPLISASLDTVLNSRVKRLSYYSVFTGKR